MYEVHVLSNLYFQDIISLHLNVFIQYFNIILYRCRGEFAHKAIAGDLQVLFRHRSLVQMAVEIPCGSDKKRI